MSWGNNVLKYSTPKLLSKTIDHSQPRCVRTITGRAITDETICSQKKRAPKLKLLISMPENSKIAFVIEFLPDTIQFKIPKAILNKNCMRSRKLGIHFKCQWEERQRIRYCDAYSSKRMSDIRLYIVFP